MTQMEDNTSPAINLTHPAKEYVDNRLDADFHPSFANTDVTYIPQLDRYGDKEESSRLRIWNNAKQERNEFVRALEKYQAENGEAERVRLDLPDKAAWKAVLDVANDAENKYRTTTAKGVNGALHCFCRKLGDSGDTLLQWLKLLPDGDYTSILCGGLKMIIQAAVKTSELRETIFKTIRQIPEIIKDAMFHFDLYTSLVLHERVSDLYSTILNTLRGIVEWYNRRPSGRIIRSVWEGSKAIVGGSAYGKEIEKGIARVKARAAAMKDEVERCMHKRLGDVKTNQAYHTLQNAETSTANKQVLKVVNRVYSDLKDIQREAGARWEHQALYFQGKILAIERAVMPTPPLKKGISPRKLLRILSTSPQAAQEDIPIVLKEGLGPDFPTGYQEHAHRFLNSSELQAWLTIPYSGVLMVNGDLDGDQKLSPLSVVCAMLLESLGSVDGALSMNFFCGLHTQIGDPATGPIAMIKSLIAQLLSQHDFDLDFIHLKDQQELEANDLDTVCDLFSRLITQVPQSTPIFCIVDGISYYETSSQRSAACFVMSKILELIDEADVVLKLLITAPGKSAYVKEGVRKRDILWLPELDHADSGSPHNRHLREATKLRIQELQEQMDYDEQDDIFE